MTKTKAMTYSGEVLVGGVSLCCSGDLILSLLNLKKSNRRTLHYIWFKPANPLKRSQYNELWSKDENPEKGHPHPMSTDPSVP